MTEENPAYDDDDDEWFQQLCNPDYNPVGDRNRRSIGELHVHSVGTGQIGKLINISTYDFKQFSMHSFFFRKNQFRRNRFPR